jgi:glycosyltransferase involved in cell wall biosynthesis
LKIIHLIDSGGLYGAEMVVLRLMSEQKKCNLEPILFSIGEPYSVEKEVEIEAKKQSLDVRIIRMRKGLNLSGALCAIKMANELNADIIHCHGYKANILMGILPNFIRKKLIVSTLHGWTSTKRFSRKTCIEWLDAIMMRKADKCTVVSRALLEHPRIKSVGLHPVVINNGIPKINFSLELAKKLDTKLFGFCKDSFVIGSIGRLAHEKGFDYLIEAFKLCIDENINARMVIIGEGCERKKLEAHINRYGLNNQVLLPGYRNNAIHFLPLFDVFVLPSFTEGLPITLLEAMQASRPCIATIVGDVPYVLEDGKCGILINSKNVTELYKSISFLYNSEQLREKLGQLSRQRALTKFSASKMAHDYYLVYKELQHHHDKK